MNPEISVIVPAYNVENYIKRAINSILAQSFQNFEIIIINDASTDDTNHIIQECYSSEKKIQIIQHKYNSGLGAARNTGITHAKGKYIVFIDSDDWIENNMLEDLYSTAEAKNADVVACGVWLAYADGRKEPYHSHEFEIPGGLKAIEMLTEYKIGTIAWNKLYRKELIDKHSLWFPPIYHEDVSFAIQTAYFCRYFVSIPHEFYNYFQNPQSITRKKLSEKHMFSYIELFKLITQFIDKIDLRNQINGNNICNKLYFSQIQWIIPNFIQFYNQTEENERNEIMIRVLKQQLGDGFYFVKGLIDYFMWAAMTKNSENTIQVMQSSKYRLKAWNLSDILKKTWNNPKKAVKYLLPYGFIKYLESKR